MIPTSIRILLVDDMIAMRQMIRGMLREQRFTEVFEAENGEAAWRLFEQKKQAGEPFDLVLADYNMPVMTGLDLLKKVREADPEIPFVMITADAEINQISDALKLGVSNYLVKPLSPSTFFAKFEAAWKKHHPEG